jgi:rhodanese-related sulfurtransferase
MTELREIDAPTLKAWLDADKAVLIDIREADEYPREHIAGSRLVPLSGFNSHDFDHDHGKIGVFHCASGNRTCQAAPQILAAGFAEVYRLKGGLASWKGAGLPINVNRKAPISIMRQVQIVAGTMMVLAAILAVLVSPWFIALGAFVGVGLMFAGLSGTCAMANLLAVMPWNRPPTTVTASV